MNSHVKAIIWASTIAVDYNTKVDIISLVVDVNEYETDMVDVSMTSTILELL